MELQKATAVVVLFTLHFVIEHDQYKKYHSVQMSVDVGESRLCISRNVHRLSKSISDTT